MQSVLFTDADHFWQWCGNDPIRFEHPLLFAQLRRDADALWRAVSDGIGARDP
jgi:hypothetical protein